MNEPRLTGPRGVRIVANWTTGVDPIFAGFRARTGGDAGMDRQRSNRLNIYQAPISHTFDAQPTQWRAALSREPASQPARVLPARRAGRGRTAAGRRPDSGSQVAGAVLPCPAAAQGCTLLPVGCFAACSEH